MTWRESHDMVVCVASILVSIGRAFDYTRSCKDPTVGNVISTFCGFGCMRTVARMGRLSSPLRWRSVVVEGPVFGRRADKIFASYE